MYQQGFTNNHTHFEEVISWSDGNLKTKITLLQHACYFAWIDDVRRILANINTQDYLYFKEKENGDTAFHFLFRTPRNIPDNGILNNTVDKGGLYSYGQYGCAGVIFIPINNIIECTQILLDHGLHPSIPNHQGITPYDLALKFNHEKLTSLLDQYMYMSVKPCRRIKHNIYSKHNI